MAGGKIALLIFYLKRQFFSAGTISSTRLLLVINLKKVCGLCSSTSRYHTVNVHITMSCSAK